MPQSNPTMYLHVGSHKTGTTSIQSALTNSRPALARNGLFYPDFSRFGSGSREAHHCLAHELALQNKASAKVVSECVAEIRSIVDDGGIPIVSSEGFNRHFYPEDQPHSKSERTSMREAYLSRAADCFQDIDVAVILYLRHPVEFAESLYSTRITNSNSRGDFDRLLLKKPFVYDYNYQISLYEKYFGSVEVVHFDDAKKEGIVKSFFRIVGADADSARELHVRPTPSKQALSWIKYRRMTGTDNRDARLMAHFANSVKSSGIFDSVESLAYWSSREQLQEFQDRFCSVPVAGRTYPYLERDHFSDSQVDQDFSAIDQAFLDWQADNARELAFRRVRKTPHFTPMRADKVEIIAERQSMNLHAAVCVITEGEPARLQSTLSSLAEAHRPANTDLSVVVVENGDMDDSRAITESFGKQSGLQTAYCREDKTGHAAASNRAVDEALATGADIILFYGGEGTVSPAWIEKMVSQYRATDLQLLGGPVRLTRSTESKNPVAWLVRKGLDWSLRSEARTARRIFERNKDEFIPVPLNNWLGSREVFDGQAARFSDSDGYSRFFFNESMIFNVLCGFANGAIVYEIPPAEQVNLGHVFDRGRDLQQTSVRYSLLNVGKRLTKRRCLPKLLFKSAECIVGPIVVLLTAGIFLPSYVRTIGELVGLASPWIGAQPSPGPGVKKAEV